ncbi:MAG: hypothetical protein GC160_15720 [Acidobacteria bacterium]|nr:hypothetical protein [Acidobacteriota bacterium]
MTTRILSSHVAAVILAAAGTPLTGGPVGFRPITNLVSGADVIVLGEIGDAQSGSETSRGELTLLISDVLKGEVPNGPVRISCGDLRIGLGDGVVGKQALIFAVRSPQDGGDELELMRMVDGNSPYVESQIVAAKGPIDRVMQQSLGGDSALQRVIGAIATLESAQHSPNGIIALSTLAVDRRETDTLKRAFSAMRASQSPTATEHGTNGLVALGQLDGLQALDADAKTGRPTNERTMRLLEDAYASTDERGIAILADWLKSSSAMQRRTAAGALARIHTPEAVMELGPALNSTDFQVRWRAVGGLSMFANNVPLGGAGPAPGAWSFRSDETIQYSAFDEALLRDREDAYLGFWRSWWTEHQDEVRALASGPKP